MLGQKQVLKGAFLKENVKAANISNGQDPTTNTVEGFNHYIKKQELTCQEAKLSWPQLVDIIHQRQLSDLSVALNAGRQFSTYNFCDTDKFSVTDSEYELLKEKDLIKHYESSIIEYQMTGALPDYKWADVALSNVSVQFCDKVDYDFEDVICSKEAVINVADSHRKEALQKNIQQFKGRRKGTKGP